MRAKATIGRLTAALGIAIAISGWAAPALAGAPVDLEGEFLRDDAGVLSTADETAVEKSLEDLFERTGILLSVVLVDSFDAVSDAPAWADETARLSGLGSDDALLAIATGDRNYAYSVDADFPLTNAQLDEISSGRLIPELRNDDWAGGIAAFADGIGDEMEPGPPWPAIIGGAVVVAVAGGFAVRWARRRHVRAKAARREREELDALAEQADAVLVELDDSLKTSAQEVGFAAAQFGEDATAAFRQALDVARGQVAEAFAARHALGSGDDAAGRRGALEHIIALCTEADAALDAQAGAFDELRALEREAPRLREELRGRQPALTASLASARAIEVELTQRYGSDAVAAADGSIAQAERLAAFAGVELDRADEELAAGHAGVAAVRIRSAQQAMGQIDELVAGISVLATSLADAAIRLEAALADTRADVAAARAAVLDDPRDAAELDDAADAAERAVSAIGTSPIEALSLVETANAALAEVAGRVQDRAVQRERAVAQLERVTAAAKDAIRRATSYIETRRGVVGVRARTLISAAEGTYARSVAAAAWDDPITALAAAQRASAEAARALSIARDDVAREDPLPPSYGDDAYDGAATGGILSWLFGDSDGGGSSRSGWSSSSRSSWSSSSSRSSHRSSASRSSSSRSRSSSSRRSGGSRSSSSRRSGGGRF